MHWREPLPVVRVVAVKYGRKAIQKGLTTTTDKGAFDMANLLEVKTTFDLVRGNQPC